MARKQMTKLAQAIALITGLPTNEQQTVADLIRLNNPPQKKTASKKRVATATDNKDVEQVR